jgi:hypothetical protein
VLHLHTSRHKNTFTYVPAAAASLLARRHLSREMAEVLPTADRWQALRRLLQPSWPARVSSSAVLGEMEYFSGKQKLLTSWSEKVFFEWGEGIAARLTHRFGYLCLFLYCRFVRRFKRSVHVNNFCAFLCHSSAMLVGWQRFRRLRGQSLSQFGAKASCVAMQHYRTIRACWMS